MNTDTQRINEKILHLWRTTDATIRGNRMPLLYPEIKRNGLVFVGFNPSFPEAAKNSSSASLYEIEKLESSDHTKLLKVESEALEKYVYFSRMRKLSAEIKLEWSHLDIFCMRESKQKKAVELVWNKKNKQLTDFGLSQFNIFLESLKLSNPRIVIIANAQSAEICELYLRLCYDDEHGHYTSNVFPCPFHLSSILSGGRLDNYSLKRLTWHIRESLRNLAIVNPLD